MKTKIEAVSTEPEVKIKKDDLITVHIDREMTDGGLRTNGKLYVGDVTVPKHQAEDMLRRQEEYWETKKKLTDPNISVRMKSDFQKEALFLADPGMNAGKKNFTRDYGLLGMREWTLCNKKFQKHLLELRFSLYGY
jgi:hypothetical protein